MTDSWIERVKQADAEAEESFAKAKVNDQWDHKRIQNGLIAIAAELRAQRIARRPGAGQ